jgi:hypothetical protein
MEGDHFFHNVLEETFAAEDRCCNANM